MAATDQALAGSVLAASLLLPGLSALCESAHAEAAPEQGVVALKLDSYRDSQPGWKRIRVQSPHVYALLPLAGDWVVEGSWVGDSVSGATPRMHTFESGATPYMHDYRKAADVKVTRYFPRAAVSAGLAYSDEHDYTSRALSLEARLSSDDNNTTWTAGYGATLDRIDSTFSGGDVANQRKRTSEFLVGVTQVLTPVDIVQLNVTRSLGRGYYNDPYKDYENRPDRRNASTALLRWNHHLEGIDASLRSSYRYYSDTFGVRSHTLGFELVKSVGAWTFTPGLRWYSQGAADFYFDPVRGADGLPSAVLTRRYGNALTGYSSADQRLAAFGALTWSLKLAYQVDPLTQVDLKLERYQQRSGLKWSGSGSPDLAPLTASFVQLGLSRKF